MFCLIRSHGQISSTNIAIYLHDFDLPEDIVSLPQSQDILDRDRPPLPFQPGKFVKVWGDGWFDLFEKYEVVLEICDEWTDVEPQSQKRWFRGLLVWPPPPWLEDIDICIIDDKYWYIDTFDLVALKFNACNL